MELNTLISQSVFTASERQILLTSTNSLVSLKADVSKPRFLGELERMKPKSMWMMCPSESSKMFPLCLRTGGQLKHLDKRHGKLSQHDNTLSFYPFI